MKKIIKKTAPKWIKYMNVEVKQKVDLKDVLHKALNKYTVRDILTYISVIISLEHITYAAPMMRLLATEKDVEGVKSMVLLRYMLDNWNNKEFLKKAGKNFVDVTDRAEKYIKKSDKERRTK